MHPGVVNPIASFPKADLGPLFDEEASLWARDLLWNFAPTRRRLETALDERTLRGFVVNDQEGACAYATYAIDEDRGVVGSCFALPRARAQGLEAMLTQRILDRLLAERPRLIDCQTLFSSAPDLVEPFAARGFDSAPRVYMTLSRTDWLATRRDPGPMRSLPLPGRRNDLRSLARIIHEAHAENHGRDASSSFDTLESCERILGQILLDEVCGPFDPHASRRLEDNGRLVATCIVTWPHHGIAHVSEVATAPSHRRLGLARLCLEESLREAFERSGATAATLSVTASNTAARALYESSGFVPRVSYESHVWRRSP
jgi:ribosomal protein S18 acetylase RimI-like enzyme